MAEVTPHVLCLFSIPLGCIPRRLRRGSSFPLEKKAISGLKEQVKSLSSELGPMRREEKFVILCVMPSPTPQDNLAEASSLNTGSFLPFY